MNKILIVFSLATTLALIGCGKKETPPETGATTTEHLDNAAAQAHQDIATATDHAESEAGKMMDHVATDTKAAADSATAHAEDAAASAKQAAKDATAAVAGSVEQGAAEVREKVQN